MFLLYLKHEGFIGADYAISLKRHIVLLKRHLLFTRFDLLYKRKKISVFLWLSLNEEKHAVYIIS